MSKGGLVLVVCIALGSAAASRLPGRVPIQSGEFLQVQGREFVYKGQELYLSGTNTPWVNYGNDFGNDQWQQTTKPQWQQIVDDLGAEATNSIRVWIHVEGDNNPQFDQNGYVIATDSAGTLISDLREFLDLCQQNNIFANLVLWNGALMRNQNYENLMYDNAKLQSYIDNALIPIVQGLKDHPALGAWEPMNEPEGLVTAGVPDSSPCFDTTHLTYTRRDARGPGWTGKDVPFRDILLFTNWIADAIHGNDPKALVSTGTWSHFTSSDSVNVCENPNKCGFNHFKDECLLEAGGRPLGTMDFWQFHAYPYDGQWQFGQPWTGLDVNAYELDAPVVVGEFPTKYFCDNGGDGHGAMPDGYDTVRVVEELYNNDFNGGWTWGKFYEDPDIITGIKCLDGRTDHGVIDVIID